MKKSLQISAVVGALFFCLSASAQTPIEHTLLISIDGMHSIDLSRYIAEHKNSPLAGLAFHGLQYANAMTTMPSDSFPGILALVTGGSPRTTGVWYDAAFGNDLGDRNTCKAGAPSTGGVFDYSEAIDIDENLLITEIDSSKLAVNPGKECSPVYPHDLLRVNNIFEVLGAAGKRTAWADKHPAYDLLRGPSGKGVDDLYLPEINANGAPDSIEKAISYDRDKVEAVIHQIRGFEHTGQKKVGVPALLGLNFQAVSVAQKLKGNGYLNASGAPSLGLEKALTATDEAIGDLGSALASEGISDKTVVIITAKHGQAPIDPARRRIVDGKSIKKIIDDNHPGSVASITTDDVALIWLTDKSRTSEIAATLGSKRDELAIDRLIFGTELARELGDPASDPRAPDIVIQPALGVIYTKPSASKIAEHGGGSMDDRNVALLISNPGFKNETIAERVESRQVAPTILRMLGVDPSQLDAVRAEHTTVLPGAMAAIDGR